MASNGNAELQSHLTSEMMRDGPRIRIDEVESQFAGRQPLKTK
ncbi:hypothetical protein TBK1r_50420 [Stieleria magnilauensis]|uniref:Uncharacterized protein n=1 Tax=Stieleria magnilauensis TaxID=2527963 RepID=A0ABX5XVG8_9BACT|nr:hypothetical protein TBK1r_50420 [Planctomycetes bacterium TBK1r]